MNHFGFRFVAIISITLFSQFSYSQVKDSSEAKKDTTTAKPVAPKAFSEFILPDAVIDSGLFTTYFQRDKYFIEIKDKDFGKDLLLVSRISRGAADARGAGNMIGFAGDEINNAIIRFEKGPSHKIFIRQCSFSERSMDSTKAMYRSVNSANLFPIIAAFPVVAYAKDEKGYIFDVTDFFNGDNTVMYFSAQMKEALKLGAIKADRSYISQIKSYALNTEIKTVKTYDRVAPTGFLATLFPDKGSSSITLEVNLSIVLLPEKQMQPRYNDERVGYFSIGYTDFDLDPQGIKNVSFIKKWNLQPKSSELGKYMRGELVEPEKPIVFYIDPATPPKWVPYLIQGVNDWQVAFEQAGFKNAIVGKPAPTKEENSTWSMDDARHSVIVYKPSTVANASGPSIADPRTGEILESHINWYHNVMALLKGWYMIQASPSDKRARTLQFTDTLLGQLIRFVSSHEVGHTLGLLHNFGSSSTVPVDSLRNKAWVEKNGHTPSIMDYARFNYVAQPQDSIGSAGIFPRIGDYDKWAIEFGYRLFPKAASPELEKKKINQWVTGRLKNKRLRFGSEMLLYVDPRSQNEDLGNNAMKAGYYGIKNLQYILPHLKEWVAAPDEDYTDLRNAYDLLISQFKNYVRHVTTNIAGMYITPMLTSQPGNVYEPVPKSVQKEALSFLDKQVLVTPYWLISDQYIINNINPNVVGLIDNLQSDVLNNLMSRDKMNKLINRDIVSPGKAYPLNEYMLDVTKIIWKEIFSNKSVDIFRRNLQKSHLKHLFDLAGYIKPDQPAAMPSGEFVIMQANSDLAMSDISSIAKDQLYLLKNAIQKAIPNVSESLSKQHLADVLGRINKALKVQ